MSDNKPELYQPSQANLKSLLDKMQGKIATVATSTLKPERLVQVVGAMCARDDKLAKCTPLSILHCTMSAATLGLLPGTAQQQCFFVPRRNKVKRGDREVWEWQATFQVGFKGALILARRSGDVGDVIVELVRKDEIENVSFDVSRERPIHFTRSGAAIAAEQSPSTVDDLKRDIALAFALVQTKVGWQYAYMSVPDILRTVDRNAPKDRDGNLVGPWNAWADQMAKKTVLLRALKYSPSSDDFYARLGDAETDRPHASATVIDVMPEPESDMDDDAPKQAEPPAEVAKRALKEGAKPVDLAAPGVFEGLCAEIGEANALDIMPKGAKSTGKDLELGRDELARLRAR